METISKSGPQSLTITWPYIQFEPGNLGTKDNVIRCFPRGPQGPMGYLPYLKGEFDTKVMTVYDHVRKADAFAPAIRIDGRGNKWMGIHACPWKGHFQIAIGDGLAGLPSKKAANELISQLRSDFHKMSKMYKVINPSV